MSYYIQQVQDVLFKVSDEELKSRSEIFRDMFSLPAASTDSDGAEAEGSSDSNPIVLKGVKADDFRALLTCLYTKYVASN